MMRIIFLEKILSVCKPKQKAAAEGKIIADQEYYNVLNFGTQAEVTEA